MEEKVPVKIPITKTNAKSLMIPAPKTHKETAASKVVKLVSTDRERTRLMAMRIILRRFVTGFNSSSSTIEDHNGIIDRITHYHKNGCKHGGSELSGAKSSSS